MLRLVQAEETPKAEEVRLTDAQLVSLARDGHAHAFEGLYRRHARFAFNLAVRTQGNASDVEDIVHDAFMRSFQRLGELRDDASYRSWLGSMVVGLVRTRLRRSRVLRVLGLATGDAVDLDSLAAKDASPDSRAQLAQVYALLRTVSSEDRIAWTLRFVEQQSLEGVAALSGCSLATAKRRIARAQRFLAEHFVTTEGNSDT